MLSLSYSTAKKIYARFRKASDEGRNRQMKLNQSAYGQRCSWIDISERKKQSQSDKHDEATEASYKANSLTINKTCIDSEQESLFVPSEYSSECHCLPTNVSMTMAKIPTTKEQRLVDESMNSLSKMATPCWQIVSTVGKWYNALGGNI